MIVMLLKYIPPKTKRILKEDGAIVYELEGTTIDSQSKIQPANEKSFFTFLLVGYKHVNTTSSMLSEVAIYTDPDRFFVEDTAGKRLIEQERLVKTDGEKLRQRLKRDDIDVIIPKQASSLTELVIKHFIETGVWLFGPDYNSQCGATSEITNRSS